MCGIAGIINYKYPEQMKDTLCRMINLIHHRGPDAAGIYTNGPAGLAHARLSIIDLSGGDQPIYNEDKTVWVVFNGEIFNYPELRNDLISIGHKFYTHTDTEVLVHLYEEFGTELFSRINGQFAFAIWDTKKETLLLGRDRLGIRPLFIFEGQDRLVFGSEIKAVFADNTIPRHLDLQTLSDIFICWSPVGAATPFKSIRQIPPGHYAQFSKKGLTVTPYWQLSFSETGSSELSIVEWVEELTELLKDAARIRLRADVPVGAYLSGGIDSTYISSLVKHNFNNHLCTFSVRFSDSRFDETSFQEIAVDALETEHQTIRCNDKDIGAVFPKIIWHTETPIIRTAPAPLYMLSRLVRESNFKVVLTGEGADEIFAGYNIFKEDKVRRFWARNPLSDKRPELLSKLYPYIFSQSNGKAKRFLKDFFKKGLEETHVPLYAHMLRWWNTSQLRTFFTPDIHKKTGTLDQFVNRIASQLPNDFMTWHPLSRAQYTENRMFLSNYLLSSQGDRMAMGNSVEGRYPFLDHRVVEFACKVPPRYRMNGLEEKYILKQAAKGLIPGELIKRPKQPYRAPISHSFFGGASLDYVTDLLSSETIDRNKYFDSRKVSRLTSKCSQQDGNLLSERENMALVAILSTQLLDHLFIREFPADTSTVVDNLKEYG